jgi:hypothetical protein
MKKTLIAAALVAVSTGGSLAGYQQYTSVRHPTIEQVGDGWNFTYDLCIPAPKPMKCFPSTRTLFIPKGDYSRYFPQARRLKAVETEDDAREEAEKVSDMIEGKYKGP